MSDAVVTYVKRLRPQPGDVFVISVDGPLSAEQAERMKSTFRGAISDYKVLVVEGGVQIEIQREQLASLLMGATVG